MEFGSELIIAVAKKLATRGYVEVVDRAANGQIRHIYKIASCFAQNGAGLVGLPAQLPLMAVNAAGQVASTYILKKKLNGMDLKLDDIAKDVKNIANGIGLLQGSVKAIAAMNVLTIGLEAANLAVTAGGFAMMNAKMNEIMQGMTSIKESLYRIETKQEFDILKEFEEIKNEYADMLDSQKRKHPWEVAKYFELIKKMHLMIDNLHDLFMADAVFNKEAILQAIYVLLPMYANALRQYDRVYYFKFKDEIVGGAVWHSLHKEWMNSFDKLISAEYLDKFQEYCFLDEGQTGRMADEAMLVAYLTAVNSATTVEDNQKILECFDTLEEFRRFEGELINEAEEKLQESTKEVDEATAQLLQPAFKNAALELAATV